MTTYTPTTPADTTRASWSMPRILLHIEGAALLAAATAAYFIYTDAPLWMFLVLFTLPDISMLPYFVSRAWGAASYNILHTLTTPLILGAVAIATGWELGLALALMLVAHIGIDRLLGWGLKYSTNFKDTHLGRV